MGKFWALLFGATMAGCFGLCVVAYFVPGWWLPEQASAQAQPIDYLFHFVWLIVAPFFVLTETLLVVFLYRYATRPDGTPAKPGPSVIGGLLKPLTQLFNDQHKIEIAWSIIPGAILLFISYYQLETWMKVKFQSRFPESVKAGTPVVVAVSARQFEWRMRYPNRKRMEEFFQAPLDSRDYRSFATTPQFSDVYVVNQLHLYKGYPVLVHLSSRDVIHGFNLPHMRVRQDILPGKIIPSWFIPSKANTIKKDGKWVDGYNPDTGQVGDQRQVWELACSQLCGWGHFRMVGRVYVHETRKDFLEWLEDAEKAQNKRD